MKSERGRKQKSGAVSTTTPTATTATKERKKNSCPPIDFSLSLCATLFFSSEAAESRYVATPSFPAYLLALALTLYLKHLRLSPGEEQALKKSACSARRDEGELCFDRSSRRRRCRPRSPGRHRLLILAHLRFLSFSFSKSLPLRQRKHHRKQQPWAACTRREKG